MNFPKFPGSAFSLAFLFSFVFFFFFLKKKETLNFPEFSGISLERGIGVHKSRFRGKTKLICWAALEQEPKIGGAPAGGHATKGFLEELSRFLRRVGLRVLRSGK